MTALKSTGPAAQLNDYAHLLRRQWWVLTLALVVGILGAGFYTSSQPKLYTSVTQVLVTATGVEDDTVSTGARTRTEINLDTEAQLLVSTAVVSRAQDTLDTDLALDQLADRLSVTVPPNTEVLTIAFRSDTARGARDGADAFAVAYLSNRQQQAAGELAARQDARQGQFLALTTSLQEVTAALPRLPEGSAGRSVAEAQVQALSAQIAVLTAESNVLDTLTVTPGRIISDATLPDGPSSPVIPINLAGGAMLGLLAGCGIALLRQRADRKLRDADDVPRRTGLRVLATLPAASSAGVEESSGPGGQAYARLRNVLTAQETTKSRVFLVAGSTCDDGTVAANLAAALAGTGVSVILVSCYEGSSAVVRLGLSPRSPGRSTIADQPQELNPVLLRAPAFDNLDVLSAGDEPGRGTAMLQTEAGRAFVDSLRELAHFVILDAPSTATSALAQTLARLADAALLVVTPRSTSADDALDAIDQFTAVGTPLLGGVLLPAARSNSLCRFLRTADDAEHAGRDQDREPPPPPVTPAAKQTKRAHPPPGRQAPAVRRLTQRSPSALAHPVEAGRSTVNRSSR